MLSISIKKLVNGHLYIIAFAFVILAAFSLYNSVISKENSLGMVSLDSRIQLIYEAKYKLVEIERDINLIRIRALKQQPINNKLISVIFNKSKVIRTIVNDWVESKKSTAKAQMLSEQAEKLFTSILDKNIDALNKYQQGSFVSESIVDNTAENENLNTNIEAYMKEASYAMDDKVDIANHLYYVLILVLLAIVFVFICLYISFARVINKNIMEKLTEAISIFSFISKGELYHTVPEYGNNEIGMLFKSIQEMRQALIEIITSVKGSVKIIKFNSGEIASGNNDLSSRTEEQASALQQTAASMEQIKTTVEHNTAHAHKANKLAMDTRAIADNGAQAMVNVVGSMETIAGHAGKISQIINVIDGIAGQTNILALNAAVEAARAGEQGRGFAVVATEVRNLAQRSADASNEIRELIERSVHDTNVGSQQVSSARETMDEIVAMVTQVSSFVSDISRASAEQETGIRQVVVAINQMDVVTQQNAALVEESANITSDMDKQASVLENQVSVFQLEVNA